MKPKNITRLVLIAKILNIKWSIKGTMKVQRKMTLILFSTNESSSWLIKTNKQEGIAISKKYKGQLI